MALLPVNSRHRWTPSKSLSLGSVISTTYSVRMTPLESGSSVLTTRQTSPWMTMAGLLVKGTRYAPQHGCCTMRLNEVHAMGLEIFSISLTRQLFRQTLGMLFLPFLPRLSPRLHRVVPRLNR